MRGNFYHLIAAVTLCWIVMSPRDTFGHADIEIRIADLTKKIEADPANAELYLKRGELHRVHEDWESALADYRRAAELDPALITVHLARGRM
ncbi:MAG TPA: hypothetical protein VLK65_09750, partial [Vicinamibacteria bacterium]|nr:hypothetical protein [Vicinamibacteria bacterium]